MACRVEEAFGYYSRHILAPIEAKAPIYEDRNLVLAVPFRDWEVFVALLMDDRGTGKSSGSDLRNHEVKSVRGTGGLEYQYHRKTGLEKLEHDKTLTHVLIAYDNRYRNLDVYVLPRELFAEIAERQDWRGRVWSAYHDPDSAPQQRCRISIPFADVQGLGDHVMVVRHGRLQETPDADFPSDR